MVLAAASLSEDRRLPLSVVPEICGLPRLFVGWPATRICHHEELARRLIRTKKKNNASRHPRLTLTPTSCALNEIVLMSLPVEELSTGVVPISFFYRSFEERCCSDSETCFKPAFSEHTKMY